jgi:hypothetical protein
VDITPHQLTLLFVPLELRQLLYEQSLQLLL